MCAGNEFSLSGGKLWVKLHFFEKKLKFSSSTRTLKMKFFVFGFKISTGLSKVQLTCPLKIFFPKMQLFSKFKIFFEHFWLWLKQFAEFPQVMLKVCQNFFLRVQTNHSRRFCINEIFVTFFERFSNLTDKTSEFSNFSKEIWARSLKLLSASPEEDFEDNLLFLPFIVFLFFSRIWSSGTLILSKILEHGRQNCISCVPWNILKVNRFFLKHWLFSICLELWV